MATSRPRCLALAAAAFILSACRTAGDGQGGSAASLASAGSVSTSPNGNCVGATCYYLTVFATPLGTDPSLAPTGYAHTFASFVAVTNGAISGKTEINWLSPAAHAAGWVAQDDLAAPVPGANYPIAQTLADLDAWNAAHPAQLRTVDMWGPLPIDARLYKSAKDYRAQLDGGSQIRYKAVDRFSRVRPPGKRALNGIHAVSDADMVVRRAVLHPLAPFDDGYLLRTGDAHGLDATRMVVSYLKPYMTTTVFAYDQAAQKVADLMGLNAFKVPMSVRSAEVAQPVDIAVDTIKAPAFNDPNGPDPGDGAGGAGFTPLGSVDVATGFFGKGSASVHFAGGLQAVGILKIEFPPGCGVQKISVEGFQSAGPDGEPSPPVIEPTGGGGPPTPGSVAFAFGGQTLLGATVTIKVSGSDGCNGITLSKG